MHTTDEKTDIDRKDSQRFPSYFPPDPLFFEDYLTCRYEKRSIKANTSTDLIVVREMRVELTRRN